mmetsp:Transcript_37302/g.96391  ORF Transcript_37302/g.96391 Transcript_37302/m.96391 type:complete len:415 (-) Transcript_37302:1180-2424(-)
MDSLGPLAAHGLAQLLVVLLDVPLPELLRGVEEADGTRQVQVLLPHDVHDDLLLLLLASLRRHPLRLRVDEHLVAEAAADEGPQEAHVVAEQFLVLAVLRVLHLDQLLLPIHGEAHGAHQPLNGVVALAAWAQQLQQPGAQVDGLAGESLELLGDDVPVPREGAHGLRAPRRAGADPLGEEVAEHERLRVAALVAPQPGREGPLQLPAVLPLVLQHQQAGRAEGVGRRQAGHDGHGVARDLQHEAEVQHAAKPQLAGQRHGDVAQGRDQRVLGRAVDAADVRQLRDCRFHQSGGRRLHHLAQQQRGRGQVHVDLLGDQPALPHAVELRAELLRLQVQLGERRVEHLGGVELHHLLLVEGPRDEPDRSAGHGAARAAGALLARGLGAPCGHEAGHQAPGVVLDRPPHRQVDGAAD